MCDLGQRRCIFGDPSVQRRVIYVDAPFSQYRLEIAIGDRVPHLEEDCMLDDMPRKLRTFERYHGHDLTDFLTCLIDHHSKVCDRTVPPFYRRGDMFYV